MGGRGGASDRASGKFSGSGGGDGGSVKAGGGTVEGYGKAEQAMARKLFGKNMSAGDMYTLAGADPLKGAVVEIGIRDGKLQLDVSHKFIDARDGMTHTIFKDAKGKLAIENEAFFLKDKYQRQGIGTESIRSQGQLAKDNGVKYITAYALRNDANPAKGIRASVGYRASADQGFDGKLPVAVQRAWQGRNPLASFSGEKTPTTIRELYAKRGGRDLWIEKGEPMRMFFSLSRGSKSIKAFNKVAKAKGKTLIK